MRLWPTSNQNQSSYLSSYVIYAHTRLHPNVQMLHNREYTAQPTLINHSEKVGLQIEHSEYLFCKTNYSEATGRSGTNLVR